MSGYTHEYQCAVLESKLSQKLALLYILTSQDRHTVIREICFIGTPITEVALDGASIPILPLCPQRDFLRCMTVYFERGFPQDFRGAKRYASDQDIDCLVCRLPVGGPRECREGRGRKSSNSR